ncbi:MAG: hypothetical protein ACT4PM_01870 [Gemmatimonadales bacterium]
MRSWLSVIAFAPILVPACSGDAGEPTGPGVVVSQALLPPAGAFYRGAGPHLFLDGDARATCGSHGGFSSAVEPPSQSGGSIVADYTATFVGELVLDPPPVPSMVTYPLGLPAAMAERITFAELRGSSRVFDTELTKFELGGGSLPANILIRESPDRRSVGRTTITALAGGQHRIETYYDVWLELSLDGGRSWNPAQASVRMTLAP